MNKRTWVILGATSIIAEEFARLIAATGYSLRLVGRDSEQLKIIAADISLRYKIDCAVFCIDFEHAGSELASVLKPVDGELDLFIAQSDITLNANLNSQVITRVIEVNVLASCLFIDAYLKLNQSTHNIIFLSSVAACFGRAKNSFYGASKAAVEVYLQGLQRGATKQCRILIARLGFIDTRQTYGLPGIFYAAEPKDCAKACWKALKRGKKKIYYPWFWRWIMTLLKIVT